MIVSPKVRTAAADRKRLAKLEARRNRVLYREPPPDRVPPPITLPVVSMGSVTDADVGLTPDPVAQQRVVAYLSALIAYRMREAQQARPPIPAPIVVNVELDDEALSLSSDDAVILAELRRLEAMPLPRWMATAPGRLAS